MIEIVAIAMLCVSFFLLGHKVGSLSLEKEVLSLGTSLHEKELRITRQSTAIEKLQNELRELRVKP